MTVAGSTVTLKVYGAFENELVELFWFSVPDAVPCIVYTNVCAWARCAAPVPSRNITQRIARMIPVSRLWGIGIVRGCNLVVVIVTPPVRIHHYSGLYRQNG